MAIVPGARSDPVLSSSRPLTIRRHRSNVGARIAVAAPVNRARIRCWKTSLSQSSMIGRVL